MNAIKKVNVSSKTSVQKLASSLLICIEENSDVEVRAIGASAVSQAFKGIASARTRLPSGRDLLIRPGFDTIIDNEGLEKTVLVFRLIIQ